MLNHTPAKSEAKKKDTKKAKTSKKEEQKPPDHCKTHGANWSHNTKDCRNPGVGNGNNGNKTWSCKADEDKKKSQKELATTSAKAVKGQVKKHLASAKKKRESDDNNEEGECFLDGFNYKQMESLTLNDNISDEISV